VALRLTQGTFSFLPDLTDEQIRLQLSYCLDHGWPITIEYTDDPHPRNTYWEMWGLPLFDMLDPAAVMEEIALCRAAYSHHYVRVSAFDRAKGRQTVALSFIVNRPSNDPGFCLQRQEVHDRVVRYTLHSYATDRPEGQRFLE
jgi:ribulose-bisphosphate carboxylase small chain